jgi:hypothetical protein
MYKYFLFFALMGLFISCEDDSQTNSGGDKGELNINFKLVYGDEPFQMFKNYTYPETGDVFFMSRVSFFVAEAKLKSATQQTDIKDIDYLNLTNAFTGNQPNKVFQYNIKNIDVGSYTNLQFGVGVPKSSNAKQPKDFAPGSTLSSSAEYWSSWKSYIFFRSEGLIGLNGGPLEDEFALHIGADDGYVNFDLAKNIVISKDQTTDVEVVLDMKKFFSGKQLYDIRTTQQIHSLSQLPLIKILAANLASAIK